MFKIVPFQNEYRDDTILCFLLAKDAISADHPPRINEDLFDIQKNYFDKGDMFWIALDHDDRVIGMIGTRTVSVSDMWLKRFFVKPTHQRKGLGSALLATAEEYAKIKGVVTIHTRFLEWYSEASVFYPAKGFVEVGKSNGIRHFSKKISNVDKY